MAAISNLIIDQGNNFSSDANVKDANGNAFNLTGYTTEANGKRLCVNKNKNDHNVNYCYRRRFRCHSFNTLTTARTRVLDAPERYVYDVEITNTSTGT